MANNKFKSSFYPYPTQMRGTFCEINKESKSRFVEVYHIKYNKQDLERLKIINCLDESLLGQYINLVGKDKIGENTYFIYKIKTYLANPAMKDSWDFNNSIEEYEQFGFVDFDKLVDFCNKKWGIQINDFKPQSETNIPN